MQFVVKLFPEITIKSKPVRKQLIAKLRTNITRSLKLIDRSVVVKSTWDKLDIFTEVDEVKGREMIDVLAHIAGIANFIVVKEYEFVDLDDTIEKVAEINRERLRDKKFVVRVKRVGTHDFNSHEAEQKIGGGLLAKLDTAGVDLHKPDETVRVEIRKKRLFVVEQVIQGLGGYPIGGLDPVLSLISGGFDSTVSTYLTMKRGMPTHFCFFNLGGRAHEIAVKEVAYYLWERFGSSYRVRFVSIPFEGVVDELLTNVNNRYMGVILKRMMLRAAAEVAEQLEIEALVTGESVAQVSSQTLRNLSVIDQVTDMLVLRPLATMDKTEIIRTSAKIGTEEFSKSIPEYCGVISVNPTTRARMHKVEIEEERFNFDVLKDAVASARNVGIESVVHDVLEGYEEALEVDHVEVNEVIIDIRHPDEVELRPVDLGAGHLEIPFYELSAKFMELDSNHRYLLYCDRGVMSGLHAQQLLGDGYENVAVYRPTSS